MTKKDFLERTSYHKYTGHPSDNNINALFYDWKSYDKGNGQGFSTCVFARALNATKKELEDTLYDFVTGKIQDTPWYIQLIVAPTDEQRFKVPLCGSGLNRMVKHMV